jgi:Sugar kinases, ribokinase family
MVREGGFTLMNAASVSAVDATGAGDAFVGALATKVSTGCAIGDAVGCAVDVASVSVTPRGTQASYPTLEALPGRMQGVGRRD